MRGHFSSEHISFVAALVWASIPECTPQKAVERAITLQQEAAKQCDYLEKLAEELNRS